VAFSNGSEGAGWLLTVIAGTLTLQVKVLCDMKCM